MQREVLKRPNDLISLDASFCNIPECQSFETLCNRVGGGYDVNYQGPFFFSSVC